MTKYTNCVKKYMDLLSSVPTKWAEIIACNLCNVVCDDTVSCEDIDNCETVTTLSDFSITDNKVCFSYIDEKGVKVIRCFDIPSNSINNTYGDCLLTSDYWGSLSDLEKWQAIIDKLCLCCNDCICKTFSVRNSAQYPVLFKYKDCEDSITEIIIEPQQIIEVCMCETTTHAQNPLLIEEIGESCLTTTTTIPPCVCGTYSAYNFGDEPVIITFIPCEGDDTIVVGADVTAEFCACYSGGDPNTGIVDDDGASITFMGNDCFATTTTTTTTTTSTTTTTTTAPTTTTTTSTTSTTTVNPCECYQYLLENNTSSVKSGSYTPCPPSAADIVNVIVGVGGSMLICACRNSVTGDLELDITEIGLCTPPTTSTTTTTTEGEYNY
jgi:hypothetical protein